MEELYFISCPSCHVRLQIKALDADADVRFCPKCATKIKVIRAQTLPTAVRDAPMLARPVQPAGTLPSPAKLASAPVEPPPGTDVLPTTQRDFTGFEVVEDEPVRAPVCKLSDPPASPAPSGPSAALPPAPVSVTSPANASAAPPVPALTIPLKAEPTTGLEPIPIKVEPLPVSPLMPLTADGRAVMPQEALLRPRRRGSELTGTSIWVGVYTFPIRLENFRILLLLTITFTLLLLMLCAMTALADFLMALTAGESLMGMSSLIYNASIHIYVGLTVCILFLSLHQAALFLRVIEETSGGNDRFSWPREPWYDYMSRWLFVVWAYAACAGIAYVPLRFLSTLVAIPTVPFWYLVSTGAWLLFPLVLLSVMAGNAFWILLHPFFLIRLARRPIALVFLYGNAVFFYVPCSILAYLVIVERVWWLAPLVGFLWSVTALVYGRVLGRVALETSEDGKPRRKRRKSRSSAPDAAENYIELTEADILGPDTRLKDKL